MRQQSLQRGSASSRLDYWARPMHRRRSDLPRSFATYSSRSLSAHLGAAVDYTHQLLFCAGTEPLRFALQGTTNAKRVNAIDPSRHKIVAASAAAMASDRSLVSVVHETDSDGTVDSDIEEDRARRGPSVDSVCESPQQASATSDTRPLTGHLCPCLVMCSQCLTSIPVSLSSLVCVSNQQSLRFGCSSCRHRPPPHRPPHPSPTVPNPYPLTKR